jgi:hypothetical protein
MGMATADGGTPVAGAAAVQAARLRNDAQASTAIDRRPVMVEPSVASPHVYSTHSTRAAFTWGSAIGGISGRSRT